jgi:hypothetical protein
MDVADKAEDWTFDHFWLVGFLTLERFRAPLISGQDALDIKLDWLGCGGRFKRTDSNVDKRPGTLSSRSISAGERLLAQGFCTQN